MGQRLFSPQTSPFQRRLVIVPSSASKEFLASYFAEHPDYNIFGGVRIMPLSEGFLELLASIHFEKQLRIPSILQLSLRIEQLICHIVHKPKGFDREELQTLQPLLEYLGKELLQNGSRAYARRIGIFSAHLSKEFAQYGLYGESFLDDWKKEKGWQQSIWTRVYAEETGWTYPIKALKLPFNRQINYQVHVFGFSSMPKLYFEFFNRIDSAFYLLSPCAMFWEDLASDRERIGARRHFEKMRIKDGGLDQWEQYVRDTNPLLANWGKTGKEFLKLVEEGDLESDELYQDPRGESLLAHLQRDLLNLNSLKENEFREKSALDSSIQIHSSVSILREVEVLYNQLCDLIALCRKTDDPIEPKQILVLAPDLNLYAPFIQTVFGAKDSVLSYSLEGISNSGAKELLEAVLHLLSIPELSFSADAVLELMTFSSFRDRWELSLDDVAKMRRWIDRANIRLGDWENGLDRLILGSLMQIDEEKALEMDNRLWPCRGIEASDLDLFRKLVQLIRFLREDLKPIIENEKRSLSSWLDLVEVLALRYFQAAQEQEDFLLELNKFRSHFLFEDYDVLNVEAVVRTLQTLANLQSGAVFSHNAQKIAFRLLKSGHITDAKVIWLLGMDEESFPRSEPSSSLCAMKAHKDQGLVPKRTDEDRYLFLECATLAKKHLIFSYQRIDAQDNKGKAPSLVIQELMQYFENRIAHVHHPALPFDIRYFSASEASGTPAPNFSLRHFKCAQAFYGAKTLQKPFLPIPEKGDENLQERIIDTKHLRDLAKNPIRFHFQQALKMYIRSEEDENGEFLLSSLSRSIFRKMLLRRSIKAQEKVWREQGKLPIGIFGEAAVQGIEEEVSDLKKKLALFYIKPEDIFSIELSLFCSQPLLQQEGKWILPALSIPMPDGSLAHVVGSIDDVTPQGLIFHGEDKLSDWVKSWPLLLVLGCLKDPPFRFEKNLLLTKRGTIKAGCLSSYLPSMQAYIGYYEKALLDLSPLMPEWMPSLLFGSPTELEKAIQKSVSNDNFEEPYLQWLKRRNALPDAKESFARWSDYARTLFQPMLQAWEKEGSNVAD